MSHRHFTRTERVQLQTLKTAGLSNRDCAAQLGFHPSSIGRELKRGVCGATKSGYSVRLANQHAKATRRAANQQHRKLWRGSALSFYVTLCLSRYWSPEQIAGRLKRRFGYCAISFHSIYRWLWGHSGIGVLRQFLRHPKLRRKYGTRRREKQRELLKKRWIETRPAGATNRSRYGHWEGDSLVGAKRTGYLATHVERKSGYLLAGKHNGSMQGFALASEQLYQSLPQHLKHSLTLDNGPEMSDFESLQRHSGLHIYFAHPYHSWERGTNENTNGLARQFFPKSRDFSAVTEAELGRAVYLLNTRPRKRLDYETPAERLKKLGVAI